MADGWISGILRQNFLLCSLCTNFSTAEQGGGRVGGRKERGGRELRQPYNTVLSRKATKSSHIELMPHHKAKEESSYQWEQLQVMVGPIGDLYRHHSLNRAITGLAKCPPKKQTHSHWTVETLCIDSSRV